MRKELRGYNIAIFEKALEKLGYKGGAYFTGFPSEFSEWRRENFHITLREWGNRIILSIHFDPKYHFGTRHKGEDLENEIKEIIKTYNSLKLKIS